MSELGEILQEDVLAEVQEIQREAESRAATLLRSAGEEALALVESQRRRLAAEARKASRRAESAAELAVSTARMRAKGRVIDSVRERALMALEETRGRPDYGEILEALAEEALEAVEGAGVAVVHPDDAEMLRPWADSKGLAIRTDPALRLGVRIEDRGRKRSAENSLPERLKRAWNALAPGVARILWG